MISILIPTYNYNTFPLVKELHSQAVAEEIQFEIIVLDDASQNTDAIQDNFKINDLSHCSFESNAENLGRGPNLNKLVRKARHEWLLIMDCDTFPYNELFLRKYIDVISKGSDVVFGGIAYHSEVPESDELFRWVYGRKREAVDVETRLRKPYQNVLTSNILVAKKVLERFPFPEFITTYGFEDLVFVLKLKKHNIQVHHIDNAAFHLNLEKSVIFLNKYNSSLKNLKYLLDNKIIEADATPLSKLYNSLQKMKLLFLVSIVFRIAKKQIVRNLVSTRPSLLLFDFYKLGYLNALSKAT